MFFALKANKFMDACEFGFPRFFGNLIFYRTAKTVLLWKNIEKRRRKKKCTVNIQRRSG